MLLNNYLMRDLLNCHYKLSLQKFKIKNENTDCEVFKISKVKQFTPQDTGKLLRSNNDALLKVQYLHLT